jgi:tetratricopeptide (TPR) repeat protein
MASKEVMVTAPLVVLMFEWTFVRRSLRDVARESWPLYIGLAATWLLLFALNISGPRSNTAGFHVDLSPFVWWATQAKVMWMYLKLVAWPWPLVIYYEMPYLTAWSAAAPWLLFTAALLIGALYLLWRRYSAGFVLTSTFVVLAPTSIVPIASEVAAERRMYLALAGLIALAVAGGYQFVHAWLTSPATTRAANDRKALVIWGTLTMVLIVVGSLVSARRLAAYADTVTLWQDVLVHQPNNYVATYNLASYFYAHDRFEEALPYYERALMLHPADLRARNSYSQTLLRLGRTREAIDQLEQVVRLYPTHFPAYVDLTRAYIHENRLSDATIVANRALQLARSAGQTNTVAQIEAFLNELNARQAGELHATPKTR